MDVIAARSSFTEFIAGLKDGLHRDNGADRIEAELRDFRVDDAELAKFVNFASGRYTRNMVHRDACLELLVLCWSAGAVSPIHDHGGSHCFFKVQRGSLLVDEYSLRGGGRQPGYAEIVHSHTRTLHDADIDARSVENDIHRVAAVGGSAISLHVYAAPLDQCLVFDADRRWCRFELSRYYTPVEQLA